MGIYSVSATFFHCTDAADRLWSLDLESYFCPSRVSLCSVSMHRQGHRRAAKAAKADKAVMAQSAAAKSGRENYVDGAPGYNSRLKILVDREM